MRKIINMKAKILDAMVCILCRVDHHVLLSCVEHVGHTQPQCQFHPLDRILVGLL